MGGNSSTASSNGNTSIISSMLSKLPSRPRTRIFSLTRHKALVPHSLSITPEFVAALHDVMKRQESDYLINVVLDYLDDGRDVALTRSGIRVPLWVNLVQRPFRKANAALFGSSHCGKTRILQSYLRRASSRKSMDWDWTDCFSIDNVTFDVNIADNGGQEEFLAISDQLVRESGIIILVVCLHSVESMEYARAFYERIVEMEYEDEFQDGSKCLVLTSTKFTAADNADDSRPRLSPMASYNGHSHWMGKECVVSEEDCVNQARAWNVPYVPVQPESDRFVEELFYESIREYVSRKRSQYWCLLPPTIQAQL